MSDSSGRALRIALCSGIILVFQVYGLRAQVIRVWLTTMISTDPPGGHISIVSSRIPQEYEIPDKFRRNAGFFKLQHAVLVVPQESGQLLIFDSDDNKSFSDADPSVFFPNEHREVRFALSNEETHLSVDNPTLELPSSSSVPPHRIDSIHFSIQRRPNLPDSIMAQTVDDEGNLQKRLTRMWQMLLGEHSFDGTAGSFYFTDWLTARRGTIIVDSQSFDIGIQPQSLARAFDDSSNLLLLDVNQDHKFNIPSTAESFPLYRSFSLANRYFRASKVDLLGQWVEFVEIDSSLTDLAAMTSVKRAGGPKGVLAPDSSFNGLALTSVTGELIRLDSLRDRYVLLNFWGEWCTPCIQEIPTLVEAHAKYQQAGLSIIGFVQTENMEKALSLARSSKMDWPQVRLTDSLTRYFSIMFYPTNLLILPGGAFVVRTSTVALDFFERHIGNKSW